MRHPAPHIALLALYLLAISPTAEAVISVVSGTFYGTEPTANQLHEVCFQEPAENPYMSVDFFTVSAPGEYRIVSSQWGIGTDVWFGVYDGSFNPAAPANNRLAQQTLGDWTFDSPVSVNLQAGIGYRLVTSPWCSPERGIWTLVFSGPGEVNSQATVTGLDSFLHGEFDGSGATANIGCGSAEYRDSGPQRVDASGVYYLTDISYFYGVPVCLSVYTAPFNPAAPNANRIAQLTEEYFVSMNLVTGQDYHFVATGGPGEYFYLITPGTDVHIDPVLSGGWFDPTTSGQGFFLDVLGHQKQLFLGWFTYDLQRPPGDHHALMGDPGHRWLTGIGNFAAASAALELEVTTGGVFNQGGDVNQAIDGTLDLEFFDCSTGQVTYDLGTAGAAGVIPITRLTPFNVRACETLMRRSGTPRRLNRN